MGVWEHSLMKITKVEHNLQTNEIIEYDYSLEEFLPQVVVKKYSDFIRNISKCTT